MYQIASPPLRAREISVNESPDVSGESPLVIALRQMACYRARNSHGCRRARGSAGGLLSAKLEHDRRRHRVNATLAALLVAFAVLALIYGTRAHTASPSRHGFTRVGVVAGDDIWLKYADDSDGRHVAVQTTGHDRGLCNASGPAVPGYLLCAGGSEGKYAFATLVPLQVTRVEMAVSSGVLNFVVLSPINGEAEALAVAIATSPSRQLQAGSLSYYDHENHRLVLPST